jgi:peptidoglycan-associated lipoprotein
MRIALIASLFICLALSAWSQPIQKASYSTMLKVAGERLDTKDYYNALEWYEKAYEERRDDRLVPIIADLHYRLRDYNRAERWYARLLRRDDENAFADMRFRYGRLLKMNGKYEEAIPELQRFIDYTRNDTLKTLAQNELTGAEMGLELPNTTQGVTVEYAGRDINSAFSEYSAVLGRDGSTMYFAGFGDTDDVIIFDEVKPEYFARIFTSQKGDRGWDDPTPLGQEINRPGFHNSNVALSADGNTMFFTRATLDGNVMNGGKIYYSVGGDGSWGPAQELAGVNGDYIAKHPAPGELFGRAVLFFSSDMAGGYGGFDLYYATRVGEGAYGDPVNLGPRINTPGDEETPYYRDGTLYFSSTGHPGIGGFDIFYSAWDGQRWSDPTNMGKAYNTSVDDRFFSLDAEGYAGTLTSNRPGGRSVHGRTCCDDIYTVQIARLYADLVVGLFTEDRQILKGGTVSIIPMQNNRPGSPTRQEQETGNRFDFDLELDMPYLVIAEHEDYYPDTAQFNTAGLTESKTFEQRFYLKPKPVAPPEPLYDTITIEEPIVLENILYEFDSDRIEDEAESDLQVVKELMEQYPDMIIELRSHTDYRGDDAYNETLSQRRAESARRWLIREGVPRARMEAKGYGENVPYTVKAKDAALHDFLQEGDVLTPGFIDSLSNEAQREVAHAFNRRTEFQIIEGPTSIIIERKRLRRQENNEGPNRQQLPGGDSIEIHPLSSLYGKKNLKGVPIMHFEERIVDFGAVKRGEQREHIYSFVNRGDTDLVISIISACDCTTTEYDTDPVKPGEGGRIKVIFDSTEKEEAEVIDVDIILENVMPGSGAPIIETLQYKFDII